MTTESRAWPSIAIPPGETLAEAIEELGITQAELARRAGRPVQAISEIIQGRKEITAETAIELERVVGIPVHVWVRLEADYRTTKALLADKERLQAEVPAAKLCPYAEMATLGWLPETRSEIDRARNLLSFFGVASLANLSTAAAWRKSGAIAVDECSLAAWLRKGELDARDVALEEFDARGLAAALPAIRSFTRESPQLFGPKLKRMLAGLGVALVLVPHLKRTGAHGATRWIGRRAVVQLSVRYLWADIFWFTLFHELAHLLLHGRRGVFISFDKDNGDETEKEADAYAADVLIPPALYSRFLGARPAHKPIASHQVVEFASDIGVHPGVVVGRLHHDGKLKPFLLNELRQKYGLRDSDATTQAWATSRARGSV